MAATLLVEEECPDPALVREVNVLGRCDDDSCVVVVGSVVRDTIVRLRCPSASLASVSELLWPRLSENDDDLSEEDR